MFISMGEYIKLVEREKEARSGGSVHWEAETEPRGSRKSSEINGGWIIYTPRLLWEKCLCSLCIKVIEWPVLYGPFRGRKMDFGERGAAVASYRDNRHSTIYSPVTVNTILGQSDCK